jgi:hypothetical protein
VTVKVTRQARITVGGAQIDCNEGGELRIERQMSMRIGSKRSSSEYGGGIEDRRSRRLSRNSRSGQSYMRKAYEDIPRAPEFSDIGNISLSDDEDEVATTASYVMSIFDSNTFKSMTAATTI